MIDLLIGRAYKSIINNVNVRGNAKIRIGAMHLLFKLHGSKCLNTN